MTPMVLQMEIAECGVACLASILSTLGRQVSTQELRVLCGTGRDGNSMADLRQAAEHYGCTAKVWRREPKSLWRMPLPMIIHWRFQHFVVLEGMDRNFFFINDPATGHKRIGKQEFDDSFTGIAMTVEPGAKFRKGGTGARPFSQVFTWITGHGPDLLYALLAGAPAIVLGAILPFAASAFVNQVLLPGEKTMIMPLVAALGLSALLLWLLTRMRDHFLRLLFVKLAMAQSSRFLRLLLRLPIEFFSRRTSADLLMRMQSIQGVADLAARRLPNILVATFGIAVYTILLLLLAAWIAVAILALTAAYFLLQWLLLRQDRDESRQQRVHQSKLLGLSMVVVEAAAALRATSSEHDFFSRWAGHQAREIRGRQGAILTRQIILSVDPVANILMAAITLGMGGQLVLSGVLNLGQLTAIFLLALLILQQAKTIAKIFDRITTTGSDLRGLHEFEEVEAAAESTEPQPSTVKPFLQGALALHGVSFGYQKNHPAIITDFQLHLEPGQRAAIVGPPGSGKSTLAQLVAGHYQPWKGEILFDGRPRNSHPRDVLARSIAFVDQNITLFASSVRGNLSMWDNARPSADIVQAARDACIHETIIARPGEYEHQVTEGGSNFSGGQRQRLEIARALASNPSILILDEATSAMDPITEQRIDRAIRRRGCTCLIITHRLRTIRDCDLILVLDRGKVIESGTHEELLRNPDGLYHGMIGLE